MNMVAYATGLLHHREHRERREWKDIHYCLQFHCLLQHARHTNHSCPVYLRAFDTPTLSFVVGTPRRPSQMMQITAHPTWSTLLENAILQQYQNFSSVLFLHRPSIHQLD